MLTGWERATVCLALVLFSLLFIRRAKDYDCNESSNELLVIIESYNSKAIPILPCHRPFLKRMPPGGHNMLKVRVCAAPYGWFLGQKFARKGPFWQIPFKHRWVIQELAKNSQELVVFC